MIGAHRLPALVIDGKLKGKPNTQLACLDQSFMDEEGAELLLRIVDAEANSASVHDTVSPT